MNPILALVIANMVWGAGLPIFKHALTNITPFALAFYRFFFASFIFLPFVLKADLRLLKKRDWIEIIVGGFFSIFINITFLFFGLQHAESISGSIFAASQPIFLFILSILVLREKLQPKILSGILLALLGIAIILFFPLLGKPAQHNQGEILGDFYYFISTMGAVTGPVILKNVLRKVNPLIVTYFGFISSALLFFPFMLLELPKAPPLNVVGLSGVLYGIFGSSATAYFLFNYGTSKLEAQELGIFSYLNPIAAVCIAIPLLHEYPDIYFFIGTALVFLGIFVSEGRLKFHKTKIKG